MAKSLYLSFFLLDTAKGKRQNLMHNFNRCFALFYIIQLIFLILFEIPLFYCNLKRSHFIQYNKMIFSLVKASFASYFQCLLNANKNHRFARVPINCRPVMHFGLRFRSFLFLHRRILLHFFFV